MISINISSLTIHNTYDFSDIDLKLKKHFLPQNKLNKFPNSFFIFLEKIFNLNILPRVKHKYLKYDKYWIFDKLVGSKRINNHHGFSGIKYFTVMGQKIKENYIKLGVSSNGNNTNIVVAGSPSYENFQI